MQESGKKVASEVSFIGKPDGPTSFFLIKNNENKLSIRQKLRKKMYAFRRKRVIKSLKAEPHNMSEVSEFILSNGYKEISKDNEEYITEYNEMRVSFIIQYAPYLLGELAELPELAGESEDDIKTYMEQIELRQKEAEKVPRETFDIELRIFEKTFGDTLSRIVLEAKYGYIGGSASGKKTIKEYRKFFRKVYKYYGVSQEDIDNNTKRYEHLVRTLAVK